MKLKYPLEPNDHRMKEKFTNAIQQLLANATPEEIHDDRATHIESTARYYNRDVHRGAFAVPNDLR